MISGFTWFMSDMFVEVEAFVEVHFHVEAGSDAVTVTGVRFFPLTRKTGLSRAGFFVF
jgi:hypothetical protein